MATAVGSHSAGGRARGASRTAAQTTDDVQSADGQWKEGAGAQDKPEGNRYSKVAGT